MALRPPPPPRSGSLSGVVSTFSAGHEKAGDATGSQSSIGFVVEAANDTPLVTLPQLILNVVSSIENHTDNPVTSESDIKGASPLGVVSPFLVDNTGGSGSGTGLTILDEGVLVNSNTKTIDIIGAGVIATDGGGNLVNLTISTNISEIVFTNTLTINIPAVTTHPVFTVWIDDPDGPTALFNSAMFNELLLNDDFNLDGNEAARIYTPSFTATYDAISDVLIITLPQPKSGVVSIIS